MKWTQRNFLNAHFRAFGPKYSPTLLYDRKGSRDHFKGIVILTNLGSISWPLGIFSFPGDAKLTPDGLGFQWNSERKTFWTLTFKLVDRNIALLHFKTERVAETALDASWFWQTSSRFRGTWKIFWCPGDCKPSPDVAWFAVKWTQENFLNFHFRASGPKYSPSSL